MDTAAFDAGLPEGGWEALRDLRPAARFAKNALIYEQGALADCFYYLKAGRARIFLSSAEGLERTLTVREAGSVIGEAAFFDGMPRMSSARALEPCALVPVDEAALLEAIAAHPRLAAQMLRALARTVRMLSAQVDDATFLAADRRLARLLLALARPMDPARGTLAAAATHEELAQRAGVSRVTVSRVLASFGERGWTATRYRSVVLLDPGALSAFACGGEGAL